MNLMLKIRQKKPLSIGWPRIGEYLGILGFLTWSRKVPEFGLMWTEKNRKVVKEKEFLGAELGVRKDLLWESVFREKAGWKNSEQ
jgi:hypothetical protein